MLLTTAVLLAPTTGPLLYASTVLADADEPFDTSLLDDSSDNELVLLLLLLLLSLPLLSEKDSASSFNMDFPWSDASSLSTSHSTSTPPSTAFDSSLLPMTVHHLLQHCSPMLSFVPPPLQLHPSPQLVHQFQAPKLVWEE
jgi:hypothetical protein